MSTCAECGDSHNRHEHDYCGVCGWRCSCGSDHLLGERCGQCGEQPETPGRCVICKEKKTLGKFIVCGDCSTWCETHKERVPEGQTCEGCAYDDWLQDRGEMGLDP